MAKSPVPLSTSTPVTLARKVIRHNKQDKPVAPSPGHPSHPGASNKRSPLTLKNSADLSMVAVPKGEITFAQYASLAGRTDMGASLRDLVLGAQKQIGSLAGSLQEQQLGMMPEPSRAARDIGSTYWYLALLTKRLGLDLGEILKQNLAYNLDRWGNGVPFVYDMGLPALQSLPGRGRWYFLQYEEADHLYVQVTVKDEFGDDHLVGDRLTDNTVRKDGYRFHDVHHLSHAVYLSWSPTLRSVLHRKRKVHWELDNNEDGARATQAEEHITNLRSREPVLISLRAMYPVRL